MSNQHIFILEYIEWQYRRHAIISCICIRYILFEKPRHQHRTHMQYLLLLRFKIIIIGISMCKM